MEPFGRRSREGCRCGERGCKGEGVGIGITETKGRVGEGNEGEGGKGWGEGEEEGNRRGEERVPAYHSSVIIYYRNYLSIYAIYSIDFINLLLISSYPFLQKIFFPFIFHFHFFVPFVRVGLGTSRQKTSFVFFSGGKTRGMRQETTTAKHSSIEREMRWGTTRIQANRSRGRVR